MRTERGAHCNIKIYTYIRMTFKFITGRKNWATKIRRELVIRMISCFPIYINDYRKLGGIVCGRNCVIYLDALYWPVQRISRGQIWIWPPYMWKRSYLIIYNPGWYVKKKKQNHTWNTRLELVNVGRLSFKSSTSTLSIRIVCLGGCPLSVAATDSLYIDFSSWSSDTLVLITPVMRSMKNSLFPSESRPETSRL